MTTNEKLSKMMSIIKYIRIIEEHDGIKNPTKMEEEIIRLLETLPIAVDAIPELPTEEHMTNGEIFDDRMINTYYDLLKLIAEIYILLDRAKPIMDKYNPDDTTKNKVLEYIKKMEENDE